VFGASVPVTSGPYWTNISGTPGQMPPAEDEGNMVWDSTDGYLLHFGGDYDNESQLAEVEFNYTYTFLHGTWTNVSGGPEPPSRTSAMMSDDPSAGGVILFGGEALVPHHTYFLNDTWLWTAGAWQNITPVHSPPPTYWGSMAYDAALGAVVLFGGDNQTSEYSNQTWTFSGGAWHQIFPATLPPGREAQEMVYDSAASELVMFGGENALDLNDTWTFSAGNWAPTSAGNHPGARVGAGLAYDNATGQVELFGGNPAPDDYYANWFFSNGAWTEYNLTNDPPNPSNPWQRMVFDPVDNYTVLFYTVSAALHPQTWTLTVPSGAPPPPPPPPPGRLYVLLDATPSEINLTHSTTFTAVVVPLDASDRYAYSTVPQGCTGQNASSFQCTPTEVGHFVVGVNVTAPNGSHGAAVTSLNVVQNATSPPGTSAGNSNTSSIWWIVIAVVIVIAIFLIFAVARRRKKSPPPPPAFSPPPPPTPPPSAP
jgi:hypothetical protein